MTKETANQIIANYKPHDGFYDLSEKPKMLSHTEYAKILDIQNILIEANENIENLKQHSKIQLQKFKEFAVELQQCIFQHWGDAIYE